MMMAGWISNIWTIARDEFQNNSFANKHKVFVTSTTPIIAQLPEKTLFKYVHPN
jgi:hypothetical protein